MTPLPIIEVRAIGKRYTIDHLQGGYVALRDVLASLIQQPFRYLKKRATRLNSKKSEAFWALSDVSFSVMPGESIGVIGSNGAGKSTLLKILTGITPPTVGEIVMRGRVASMLEVGTGFHPELTGRENIYLNGAILGMGRKELELKFEDIVTFAGVEQFLDTPVKYYSSGMYVRLAFSVAAHLEPDILLIDEVLAVGDAEFQKKCLGKMEEVTRKDGRTILFVSHNLAAVQSLCARTVLLEHGRVVMVGPTKDVIDHYLSRRADPEEAIARSLPLSINGKSGALTVTGVSFADADGSLLIRSDSRLRITVNYTSDFPGNIPDMRVLITITSERSSRAVYVFDSHVTVRSLDDAISPSGSIICDTEPLDLGEGRYGARIQILPQRSTKNRLDIDTKFDVVTDMERYSYRLPPDTGVADHLIRYSFTNDSGLPHETP